MRSSGRSRAWPSTACRLDELIGYRARIEAVDGAAVAAAAQAHLHVDSAAIVLVGDIDAFGSELEAAGLGPILIERDEIAGAPAALGSGPGRPSDEEGPTAGAEEPELPGEPDEAPAEDR